MSTQESIAWRAKKLAEKWRQYAKDDNPHSVRNEIQAMIAERIVDRTEHGIDGERNRDNLLSGKNWHRYHQ
ncbi:MAG: hypothetical protein AAB737_03645 [Patescibacteria group bacterium]